MDILITNGRVIDPHTYVDCCLNVGIEKNQICFIGTGKPSSKEIIDIEGKVLAPGFIDLHMHEDAPADLLDQSNTIFNKMINMGVTTCIGGNCGINRQPFQEYISLLKQTGLPVNLGLFSGYNSLKDHSEYRYQVSGQLWYEEVKRTIISDLDAGALGVSFGLEYDPEIQTKDIIDIGKLVSSYNGFLSIHYRYTDQGIDAIREMIEVSQKSDVKVLMSHLGSRLGLDDVDASLEEYIKARSLHIKVIADCYPYTSFSTYLGSETFSPRLMKKLNLNVENIQIASGIYAGKTCTNELFEELKSNAPDTLANVDIMDVFKIDKLISHPDVVVASDGILNGGIGHPRASGTFPRLIKKYVKEMGSISLMEALRKITSYPAGILGLADRGKIEVGAKADLVVFDYENISDRANVFDPVAPPDGFYYVFVNGNMVMDQGRLGLRKPGQLLKLDQGVLK